MTLSSSKFNLGIVYGILAYGSWGFLPVYLKFFSAVPALEVLCHRVIWSALLLIGIVMVQRQLRQFQGLWRSPRICLILFSTATLLALNWGIYIYGVNTERVIETSLGYFINPLFTILLGYFFLQERLNRWQVLAVSIATLGVANLILDLGQIPWIAIALAFTFGSYGLIRKVTALPPVAGLAGETLILVPLAIALITHWANTSSGHFGLTLPLNLLFIGCGIVTALPLLWFNQATQRLTLSTLGFLQYIAPSLQLALGVFLYQEPFTHTHRITFSLIWIALAIYSFNSLSQVIIRTNPE